MQARRTAEAKAAKATPRAAWEWTGESRGARPGDRDKAVAKESQKAWRHQRVGTGDADRTEGRPGMQGRERASVRGRWSDSRRTGEVSTGEDTTRGRTGTQGHGRDG